jgi:hypothetical protein
MCLPLAAAGAGAAASSAASAFAVQTALVVGSTMATYLQQRANAKAQEKAQEQAYEANKAIAISDAINNYNAANMRLEQERARGAVEIQRVVRASREAAGAARTLAADHGVAGESVRLLLSDFERKASTFTTGVERNLKYVEEDIEARKRGTRTTMEGRILSALPGAVAKPSFFGAVLRAGAGAFDAYQDHTFIGADGERHWGVLPQATGTTT